KLKKSDLTLLLDDFFGYSKHMKIIKQIARELGVAGKHVELDRKQNIECVEYIKARYHVKRIGLDGRMIVYNGQYYEMKSKEFIKRQIRMLMPDSKTDNTNEIFNYIQDSCEMILQREIENDLHKKCLLNGTYDIISGKFTPSFSPENIILNQIPHNFDESKSHDNLYKVIKGMIPRQADLEKLEDFLSCCLHPTNGIQQMFGIIGPPGTGKTQIANLTKLLFGIDNVSQATLHNLTSDATTRVDTSSGFVNIDADVSDEDIKSVSTLKKIVTRDPMTDRAIYEHNDKFIYNPKIMFMSNGLFEMAKESDAEAIYDRSTLIKMDQRFRKQANEVKNIIEMTAKEDELESLVTYLLKNAHKIYNEKNIRHVMSVNEVQELWNEFGNYLRRFVKEWFVVTNNASDKVERTDVLNKWLWYASENKITSKGRNTFYQQFNEIVNQEPIQSRDGEERGRYYVGMKMLDISDKSLKSKLD
ncbi:MAG: DUF5906 domain-containing protein, partial [Nitrosopumilus sp.]